MPNFNLKFNMQQQQQTQWCWAATSSSVDAFYNPASTNTQCSLANRVHGQTTCCANGSTSQCNQSSATGDALRLLGRLRSQSNRAEPFNTVDQEIMAHHPVGVRIVWSDNTAHAVVISGIGDTANPLLTIRDPWYGLSYVSYPIFVSAYQGSGRWDATWFTQ